MRVLLKQAAHLGGKDHAKGVHDIPDQHLKEGFGMLLLKAGLIVEAPKAQITPSAQSISEQNKDFAERILGKPVDLAKQESTEPEAPALESESEASAEIDAESEAEESADDSDDSAKSKKKKKR